MLTNCRYTHRLSTKYLDKMWFVTDTLHLNNDIITKVVQPLDNNLIARLLFLRLFIKQLKASMT